MFKLEGNDDLGDLVLDRAGVGNNEQLGQLHGQRGGAALVLAVADQIVPRPAEHREVVDAAVLEEAPVLDGQNSIDHILRNLVVGEQAALGAVGVVAQAGNQQRLQLIAGKPLAMIVGDRLHHASADVDRGRVRRVKGLRAGAHGDGLRALLCRCPVGRVSEAPSAE